MEGYLNTHINLFIPWDQQQPAEIQSPPNLIIPLFRRFLSPEGQLEALTKTVWSKFGSWILSFKMYSPDWTEGGSIVSQACIWAPCASWICPTRCSHGWRSESRVRKASQPASSCWLVLSKIWYAGPCVNVKLQRVRYEQMRSGLYIQNIGFREFRYKF